MLAVGFTATRTTSWLPLVMPPLIPPSLFVAVAPSPLIIRSLFSEPRRRATSNPAPNSTPLTAGIANSRCAIELSTESKNGSPKPTATLSTRHSTTPPTESHSRIAASITSSKRLSSAQPPTSAIRVVKVSSLLSITRLATTPAATRPSVKRPEKWPPPRGSFAPANLRCATRSACDGRGWRTRFE